MTVFDVQRFSVHDGPGIRTTAFFKGCPLRCLWCQNPEGLEFGPGDPAGSGKVRQLSPEALAEELLADRVFFETSGGGVTFSGGEPLAQADELIACARILRAQGVSVAVESSLAVPAAVVDRVLPEIDLLLADLKVADPEDHRRWTGATNARILENFHRAAEYGLTHPEFRLQARTPLVPGHTDTESNLRDLATILDQWPGRWNWEHLEFNPLARSKYEALGWTDHPFFRLGSIGCVETFLARARAGEPVFVTEVRRAFEGLPEAQTFSLGLNLVLPDGRPRTDVLMVPRYAGAPADEATFVEEYVFAELYNRLSALGPRNLDFVAPAGVEEARRLHGRFVEAFGLAQSRQDRRGYGRAVNVLERLVDSLDHRQGTTMGCRFVEGTPVATPRTTTVTSGAVAALGRRALAGVGNRTLLGIDVGGSDIKLALVAEGRIVALLEYDWFPAQFTRIAELTDPIDVLVELAGLQARALGLDGRPDPVLGAALAPAWSGSIGHDDLGRLLKETASWSGQPGFRFEGIGLSFPDVVVADKIVGGEVYKTRGIRNNPAIDYEAEFRTLTALDDRLARHLAPGAKVSTINDGPMAAFTAVVEGTIADPRAVADGLLAHTLGTELGTGWVTEAGAIPDIPLEVYNFIIDLGSYPERAFGCDDPRSVNNFNTDLPGTLQKYTSQSGVFRLALKHFPRFRPDLMTEIVARGFLRCQEGAGLEIPTEPVDQRKPFLEYLMALPDRMRDPTVDRLFREVGEFLAVATWECNHLLGPAVVPRVLFGRMVKNATCFRLMQEGAAALDPALEFVQAADGLAESPLMKQLQADPHRTVAQFAQAVGAVYFTASQLPEAADR